MKTRKGLKNEDGAGAERWRVAVMYFTKNTAIPISHSDVHSSFEHPLSLQVQKSIRSFFTSGYLLTHCVSVRF